MIRTIVSVIRGEGIRSALRRGSDRTSDAIHAAAWRANGAFSANAEFDVLNVAASGMSPRLGGVQTQLVTRIHAERKLRNVAVLEPGVLHRFAPRHHTRSVAKDLASGIREAIAITGAKTVHFEGMHNVPLEVALRLIDSGVDVIVSVHDFSLFCARPHLLEEPAGHFCFYSHDLDRCLRCLRQTWDVENDAQLTRRSLARELLNSAKGLIFPSQFLLDQHRRLFSLPELAAEVIEPGVQAPAIRTDANARAIAFAGSVKRHKGAHLLPDLARLLPDIDIHIFGGGDEDLLRSMRAIPNISVHGYYRHGALPTLLARHRIGLVVVPSIVPESFGLVISESWIAALPVVAFDLGAQAERIRQFGGGWIAPLERGVVGLVEIVERWRTGSITANVPPVASTLEAAQAHVEVYRLTGVWPSAARPYERA